MARGGMERTGPRLSLDELESDGVEVIIFLDAHPEGTSDQDAPEDCDGISFELISPSDLALRQLLAVSVDP